MGPNGSGKSTLANAIMGHPNLEVTEGQILFKGEDITEADPDERARMGLFMAFQYPVVGPRRDRHQVPADGAQRPPRGARRGADPAEGVPPDRRGGDEADQRPEEFSSRYLNEGFSGGEKKRMEILQLALQRPEMAILDETDSGLDIDALRVVANGVNAVAGPDMGVLIITHYQRILHLVQPEPRARHVPGADRQGGRPRSWSTSSRPRATAGSPTRSRHDRRACELTRHERHRRRLPEIASEFPVLRREIDGHPITYLDSARRRRRRSR